MLMEGMSQTSPGILEILLIEVQKAVEHVRSVNSPNWG